MRCLEQPFAEKAALSERTRVIFPRGLFGFEQVKGYQLVARPQESPLLWLEMDGEEEASPGGAFLVVRPQEWIGPYEPRITEEDMVLLQIQSLSQVLILVVANRDGDGVLMLNLKSPILINLEKGLGKQIIPRNVSSFNSHHRVEMAAH